MCHTTEDIVLFQSLYQLSFEFIGNGITTLCILTDRQGIAHIQRDGAAHHIPERAFVLIARQRIHIGLLSGIHGRTAERGLTGGLCQLRFKSGLIFETCDFIP